MKTIAIIADGLLWDHGIGDCPGTVRPDAAAVLEAACGRADRVVVVSYCATSLEGAKRCRAILEFDLKRPLSRNFDLHVSQGFPVFDEVIHGD